MATLSALSDRLAPLRAAWSARLPPDSPPRDLNFPLIHMLATALDYEDTTFVHDLAYGMPITGVIPPVSASPSRKRASEASVDEWRAGIPARNLRIVERAHSAQGTDLAHARWTKTIQEVNAGWVAQPTSISAEMIRS